MESGCRSALLRVIVAMAGAANAPANNTRPVKALFMYLNLKARI
jgi:hypothetical protein